MTEKQKNREVFLRAYRYGLGTEQSVDEDGAEGGQRDAAPDRAEPCRPTASSVFDRESNPERTVPFLV